MAVEKKKMSFGSKIKSSVGINWRHWRDILGKHIGNYLHHVVIFSLKLSPYIHNYTQRWANKWLRINSQLLKK